MDEGASCGEGLDETHPVAHEERGVGKKVRVPSYVDGGQKTPGDLGVQLLLPLLEHQHQIRSFGLQPQLPEMDGV